MPYGTRAPKELATPSADLGTGPAFCFRRPGRNAAGARGSRLLDRRPPHYRCPAVPGLKTPARAILTVPGSSVLPSEIIHLPSGTTYYTAACGSAASGSQPRRPSCVCFGSGPRWRTSRCARPQPTPSPGYCLLTSLPPGSSSLPGLTVSLGYARNYIHATSQCLPQSPQISRRSGRR